jgi:hypothetical protein
MGDGMSQRRRTTDIPLIPREVLFGNPDKASPKVSHDGKQLAFLAPLAGVLNVWGRLRMNLRAALDLPVVPTRLRGKEVP